MIIRSSKLITLNQDTRPIPDGAVVVIHGIVKDIGFAERIIKRYPHHNVIELKHSVLMPGLVNAHTHLELPPLLESIKAPTFPEWVLNLIRRKKNLTAADYSTATASNIESLIQCGTTTVGEICTHNMSPLILQRCGLRGLIFREVISMDPSLPVPMLTPPGFHRSRLVTFGYSPHSPYTVDESMLRRLNKLAATKGIRLCMHVAESRDEVNLLQRKKSGLSKLYHFANWDIEQAPLGRSSFDYLRNIGLLSPNLLAIHAVQITDRDMRLIKRSGTSLVHCPRSNSSLGVGRMPLKKLLDAGIPIGLGTDSLASSSSLNLWDEMRYAYQIHRNDGITALDLLRLATQGGATALGMDKSIGTLEPGKSADFIVVPLPRKNTGDIYKDLLRETKYSTMTVVNGKILWKGTPHAGS